MKRLPVLFLVSALSLGRALPAAADDRGAASVDLSTNLAYLAFIAMSSGGLVIAPVEAQVGVSPRLSINPSLTAILPIGGADSGGALMGVVECGLYFHSRAPSMSGWKLGLVPGLAYAFDSRLVGLIFGAAGGYQWALGRWRLGALAGAREVFMDGSIFIPDLKLSVGFAL